MEVQDIPEAVLGKQIYKLRKMPKPEMELNVRFSLIERPKTKCYLVRISADFPLEGAWLSCNIPIDFLVPKNASYEMTRTESDAEQKLGNKFSATLRFKPNCMSAEFSFRAVEGHRGALEIFVSAVNSTGRCTQREVIRIAPLCSYMRIGRIDETRDYNVLHIRGSFSTLKVQAWLETCFQDIDKLGYKLAENEGSFAFESMLFDTQLQCDVKDQELIFRCENPSTTAILMQLLTRQATSEKIKLDIRPKILPEACNATLARIDRILAPISGRNNIRNLQDAVAEISAAESGESSLHPMFRSDGWKKLQGEDHTLDGDMQMNVDFLHDLIKDYAKLRGKSVTQRLPELINILMRDYSLRNLQNYAMSI